MHSVAVVRLNVLIIFHCPLGRRPQPHPVSINMSILLLVLPRRDVQRLGSTTRMVLQSTARVRQTPQYCSSVRSTVLCAVLQHSAPLQYFSAPSSLSLSPSRSGLRAAGLSACLLAGQARLRRAGGNMSDWRTEGDFIVSDILRDVTMTDVLLDQRVRFSSFRCFERCHNDALSDHPESPDFPQICLPPGRHHDRLLQGE